MKRLVLYPYKIYSSSAKKIQEVLGGIRVRPEGKYSRKNNDLVINWGSSTIPGWLDYRPIINHPRHTKVATNKLLCFQALSGNVPIPEFTTNKEEASAWDKVVARKILTGNSGEGIFLWDKSSGVSLIDAPLYVKYKKKRKEFRVHVFNGEVIGVVEKRKVKKENRPENFSPYICSHLKGWVFCSSDVIEPPDIREVAIKTVETLGLDFGAIDIVWNEHENKCYVLECNTAPGIAGTTINSYCESIRKCLL